MISEYLNVKGYQSYFLGGNTTTESLIEMIRQIKPNILAISVTLHYHIDGLKNLIERIRIQCDCTDLKIIIGGQAFVHNQEYLKLIKGDGFATDLNSFEKLIDINS